MSNPTSNKKKMLIVLDSFHIGGISKSLINLLPHLSSNYDCDLLIFDDVNLNKNLIPNNVRLLESNNWLRLLGMNKKQVKTYSIILFLLKCFYILVSRLLNGSFSRSLIFCFFRFKHFYDVAVSFSQDTGWKNISTGCNQFVIKKVLSTIKISYVHCDYKHFGGYHKKQVKTYSFFDKIVCVSKSCKESFDSMFPNLMNKTVVCENFTNVQDILEKTKYDCYMFSSNLIGFVSVSRIGLGKGLIRGVEAFRKLKGEGKNNFEWVIVGDGPEKENIQRAIDSYGLSSQIRLVGPTDNPYYYMKNANLFLLLSYHEAAPMVFGECRVLGLPVLTTDTVSAKELIYDRKLGIVCENTDDGIYCALKSVLEDANIQKLDSRLAEGVNDYPILQFNKLISEINNG